jgi:hypothetical protein
LRTLTPLNKPKESRMLTKTQAAAVGDALVEAEKAERLRRLEAGAARIPHGYGSQHLSKLPPWRQSQLVAEARNGGGFSWLAAGVLACLLLLAAALWQSSRHAAALSDLWLFLPAFWACCALFRLMLVKLRLQELLLRELLPEHRDGVAQEAAPK